MPDTISRVVQVLTFTALIVFLVHSYLTFRGKLVHRFFKSWLLLWASFIFLYAFIVFAAEFRLPVFLGVLGAHLVALSLLLCASALRANQGDVASSQRTYRRAAGFWCLLTFLSFAGSLLLPAQWLFTSANILNFLALSLYAARYASFFPKADDVVLISIFVYAGIQTFTPGPLNNSAVFAASVLLLPLKVVLYYSGYITLYYLTSLRGSEGLPILPAKWSPEKVSQATATQHPPTHHEGGLSWFVAEIWPDRKGKGLIVSVIVTLVSAIIFVVDHYATIAKILNNLLIVFQKK